MSFHPAPPPAMSFPPPPPAMSFPPPPPAMSFPPPPPPAMSFPPPPPPASSFDTTFLMPPPPPTSPFDTTPNAMQSLFASPTSKPSATSMDVLAAAAAGDSAAEGAADLQPSSKKPKTDGWAPQQQQLSPATSPFFAADRKMAAAAAESAALFGGGVAAVTESAALFRGGAAAGEEGGDGREPAGIANAKEFSPPATSSDDPAAGAASTPVFSEALPPLADQLQTAMLAWVPEFRTGEQQSDQLITKMKALLKEACDYEEQLRETKEEYSANLQNIMATLNFQPHFQPPPLAGSRRRGAENGAGGENRG